jgi:hypothetical protein
MDLRDIYRILPLTAAEYTFFSVVHRTFPKIDHILGYKASLNKCKKTEIGSCTLLDNHGIKLDIYRHIDRYSNRNCRNYSNRDLTIHFGISVSH